MAIAGRVAIVPKGDWSNATQYTRLDMVRHNNISYVAIQNNVAQEPAGATDQYWMLANDTSPMTGATSSANGKAGIVPRPMAGDQGKCLFGDGTFKEVKSSALLIDSGGFVAIDYSILGG